MLQKITDKKIISFDKAAPMKRSQRRMKNKLALCRDVRAGVQQAEVLMLKLLRKFDISRNRPLTDNECFLMMVFDCVLDLKKHADLRAGGTSGTESNFDQSSLSYLNHRISCVESLVRIGMIENLMEEMGNDMAYSVITLHEMLLKIQKTLEKF